MLAVRVVWGDGPWVSEHEARENESPLLEEGLTRTKQVIQRKHHFQELGERARSQSKATRCQPKRPEYIYQVQNRLPHLAAFVGCF